MIQYILKLLITSFIIVIATEISKRSTVLAAIIIALPLVSLLTFSWIYIESKDVFKIAKLSTEILYFGLATIPLFLILPFMLKEGYSFLLSMIVACGSSAVTMFFVKMYLLNE